MKHKFFTFFLAVMASIGMLHAEIYSGITGSLGEDRLSIHTVLDLPQIGSISQWTITGASFNASSSDASQGKYVYGTTTGIQAEAYVTAMPTILFRPYNNLSSDKASAFTIYPNKYLMFGGKNGSIIIEGTHPGDKIILTVAAKGSSDANLQDYNGDYPINAEAISTDLLLPAKNSLSIEADEQGYIWREIEYSSLGGDVKIKETAAGFCVRRIEIIKYAQLSLTCDPRRAGILTIDGINSESGIYELGQSLTIEATPKTGYYFTQWSDGVTDNPRTIVLTQDTTFTALFGVYNSGQCGESLYWSFEDNTLTISGSGAMWDFEEEQPWAACCQNTGTFIVDMPEGLTHIGNQAFYSYKGITSIVIPNSVTSIGDYAFMGCTVTDVTLGTGVDSIGAATFRANILRTDSGVVRTIHSFTCLAANPPSVVVGEDLNDSFYGNMLADAVVYVPASALTAYQAHPFWGTCNLQPVGATATEVTAVQVEPTESEVVIEWPATQEASSYSIVVSQSDEVVCSLMFNEAGELVNYTFAAPARNRNVHHNQAATQSATGWRYTITGLTPGITYTFTVTAKRSDESDVYTENGTFVTQNTTTDLSNTSVAPKGIKKILHNHQVLILRDDKTYTLTGQEIQ